MLILSYSKPVTELDNCVKCLPRIFLDADSGSSPPLYVRFSSCCFLGSERWLTPRDAPQAEPAKVNSTMPPSDNDFPPPTDIFTFTPEYLTSAVDDLISHLEESVRLRVCSVPQQSAVSAS